MPQARPEVPLTALFAKAEAASVQISPHGSWVGWLARTSGVLNLFVAPLPLPNEVVGQKACNSIPGASQLTDASDRDICFSFRFSKDDRRILYLRETEHGSELYHVFSVELPWPPGPVAARGLGRDLLAAFPLMTCAVGFVGGLQLWLPEEPNTLILSTGSGSLLWDLSELDLQSGTLTTLETNPMSTTAGKARLLLTLLVHVMCHSLNFLVTLCTMGGVKLSAAIMERFAPPPCAPLQYFVDSAGRVTGCAQVVVTNDRCLVRQGS